MVLNVPELLLKKRRWGQWIYIQSKQGLKEWFAQICYLFGFYLMLFDEIYAKFHLKLLASI